MNTAIILKSNPTRPVVWVKINISERRAPVWAPYAVTDDEEIVARGLGLKVGSVGYTLIADLGKDMEDFHSPKFEEIPTKSIYFTDAAAAQEKRTEANFFFADHLIHIKPASIYDEGTNELIVGKFKIVSQTAKLGNYIREAVLVCFGRLPSVPEQWASRPDYAELMDRMNSRADLRKLSDFISNDKSIRRCDLMQRKMLEQFGRLCQISRSGE